MFGKTELMTVCVTVACAIAAATDLVSGRIFNWLTFPFLALGLIWAGWQGGWPGAAQALGGAGVALALYGWMFWLRLLGGGDLKLLMALGAWGGPKYALEVSVMALLLGGALALGQLAWKGRLRNFVQRVYLSFVSVAVKEMAAQAPKLDRTLTFPFGVPIAAAGIWLLFADPFGVVLGGL